LGIAIVLFARGRRFIASTARRKAGIQKNALKYPNASVAGGHVKVAHQSSAWIDAMTQMTQRVPYII
jgi:hypothetical protein